MKFIKWDDMPENMKNESVSKYYELLYKHRCKLYTKRMLDIVAASLIFIIFSPLFIIISIAVKIDSKGPVLFRQIRVTQYGKQFRIFKFRTMVEDADKIGTLVTTKNDNRVTKIGKLLRKCRLDEIPQLFNILLGDMSFVGTRPEVVKYVERYTEEMMATLLLPAGVTSEASIQYKDEDMLLRNAEDVDEIYVNQVLQEKMIYNLKSIERVSLFSEIKTIFRTVVVVNQKKNENSTTVVKANKSEVST